MARLIDGRYPSLPRSEVVVCAGCGQPAVVNAKLGLSFCPTHEYEYGLISKDEFRRQRSG